MIDSSWIIISGNINSRLFLYRSYQIVKKPIYKAQYSPSVQLLSKEICILSQPQQNSDTLTPSCPMSQNVNLQGVPLKWISSTFNKHVGRITKIELLVSERTSHCGWPF